MAFSQAARDAAALTRQQNKERRAAEKLMSTGVGESKIFRDPDAPQEDSKLLDCHINGRLIRDLNFTPLQLAALSWHHTDEGFAARNEGKSNLRVEVGPPKVHRRWIPEDAATGRAGYFEERMVPTDEFGKALEQRRDEGKELDRETWEVKDPYRELIEQHVRPGFRAKLLSDNVVKSHGLRGWQPIIKDGKPVKLGNQTLAEMPDGKAKARNTHYGGLGNERLKQVNRSYLESGGASAVSDQ